jgi:OmpA-OmpF porin, OOP family
MRHRYLLGAGVALAVALSWAGAQAQWLVAPSGPATWYFGGQGGWTDLGSQSGKFGAAHVGEHYDSGFNTGARGGIEWGPWRFEEEFSYQTNGLTRVNSPFIPGGGTGEVSGNRNAFAFMTNAIYDFNIGWALTPHIGAGIGAVDLHDGVSFRPGSGVTAIPGVHNGAVGFSSSSTTEFGYQGIVGVRYNINPSLAFDLDYRYLATTDPTFHSVLGKYTSGYSTSNIVASLTVRFGAALPPIVAPPMPPAPPPVARKVFLVFFDWDRDTITPEGMQIVQQAAAAFRGGAPVTIQVTGYTDRSGSPGYNQRLSERRANNVANALVKFGVPRQAMVVSGRGENDNRVPTAPGVREPQNRRVEIVFP